MPDCQMFVKKKLICVTLYSILHWFMHGWGPLFFFVKWSTCRIVWMTNVRCDIVVLNVIHLEFAKNIRCLFVNDFVSNRSRCMFMCFWIVRISLKVVWLCSFYCQTGSGKTHTMLGDIEGGTRRHSVNCGMTPRVFEYLFSRIQKVYSSEQEFARKLEYYYNSLSFCNKPFLWSLSSINYDFKDLAVREVKVCILIQMKDKWKLLNLCGSSLPSLSSFCYDLGLVHDFTIVLAWCTL